MNKWPEFVNYPPPLEINIWLDKSELVPTKAQKYNQNDDSPTIAYNLNSPWKLTKIDWFLDKPIAAWYENVRIPIKYV